MSLAARVSSHDGHEWVAQGALLLDVRTTGEFRSEHLPGALNIPVQELRTRLGELRERARQVVVYCLSGNRSNAASRILTGAGFQVLDIGGMRNW